MLCSADEDEMAGAYKIVVLNLKRRFMNNFEFLWRHVVKWEFLTVAFDWEKGSVLPLSPRCFPFQSKARGSSDAHEKRRS
ncbi:hypothetical protein DKX38_009187 [Salix brachista]|uniref:Uncharacterized protein n=1 Tax=Salix brachista TaxID=2182728 RepID=A0A5N5MCR0_9ROSI|nr:hypothetical protein DKX38_009187 [Salix brachista]